MYHHGTTRYIFGHSYVYTNVNRKIPSLASRNTHQLFYKWKQLENTIQAVLDTDTKFLMQVKGLWKKVKEYENILGKLRGAKISRQKIRGLKKKIKGCKNILVKFKGCENIWRKNKGCENIRRKNKGCEIFCNFPEKTPTGYPDLKMTRPLSIRFEDVACDDSSCERQKMNI